LPIYIRPNREKPIRNQHPWVFSGSIQETTDDPQPGDIVDVLTVSGEFLGRGYYNAKSQIVVRLLTWEDEPVDDLWWREMLQRALAARSHYDLLNVQTDINAVRLVNAENDFLPGLIVDRYNDWLVLQALTLGIDQRKQMLAEMLAQMTGVYGIYERSDVDVREKEGLSESVGMLWGDASPPQYVTIHEFGLSMNVDLRDGHKTGAYLDQRENRRLLYDLILQAQRDNPVADYRALNLFSYTGGFGLHALAAGATDVVNVDSSFEALELAEANLALNNLPPERAEFIQANVFDYLHDMRDEGELYDVVVLDPPKFAHNQQQVDKAARGYKDLNLTAFQVVKPGGYLLTFSCSGAIDADLHQKIVFGALADSGRQAQIVRHLGPGDDHPVALTFPEGAYLKGLLLRVY
jgi:23S rRNA (cytosine1962-C5)-methyltransferase